jgi:hypothetical protein
MEQNLGGRADLRQMLANRAVFEHLVEFSCASRLELLLFNMTSGTNNPDYVSSNGTSGTRCCCPVHHGWAVGLIES